jgi:hypothetical protein
VAGPVFLHAVTGVRILKLAAFDNRLFLGVHHDKAKTEMEDEDVLARMK